MRHMAHLATRLAHDAARRWTAKVYKYGHVRALKRKHGLEMMFTSVRHHVVTSRIPIDTGGWVSIVRGKTSSPIRDRHILRVSKLISLCWLLAERLALQPRQKPSVLIASDGVTRESPAEPEVNES